jgi:RNA polymerase sigma factor (sigma-70 family)
MSRSSTAPLGRPSGAQPETLVADAFAQHQTELFAFLRARTRDSEAANDLLSEAFLRLSREVAEGRAPLQLRPWLFRVCANLSVSRARNRAVADAWLDQQRRAEGRREAAASPEAIVLDHERLLAVRAVVDRLGPDARTAILMTADGFAGTEIADAIGRTDVATRALLCPARRRARSQLTHGDSGRDEGTGMRRRVLDPLLQSSEVGVASG